MTDDFVTIQVRISINQLHNYMAKKERKEDLNPRGNDVEEKVHRMMDPSIPDEPTLPSTSSKSEATSAPELPIAKGKSSDSSSPKAKSVNIPISHHGQEVNSDIPVTTVKEKQIALTEHGGNSADVAEKLDEAIAELGTTEMTAQSSSPKGTEPVQQDSLTDENTAVASPETDKAVDEIVAEESDEILEVEDAIRDSDEPVETEKKSRRGFKQFMKDFWANPKYRKATIISSAVLLITAFALPWSRYFLLNSVGVRASSSVLVLDQSTKQPLKNVKVSLGNIQGVTDSSGKVKLEKIKLGSKQLTIQKRAFAKVEKTLVIGWGSNPLGDYSLTPTGDQYSFKVVDYLSGKPVAKAEASSGEANALSDENGEIKLTVEQTDAEEFTVEIVTDGYRTEEVQIGSDDAGERSLKLVPSKKHAFITKRSGKFDVYSVYVDGKDETLVLAGSGHEREDMVLVPHPSDNIVAYVSTRPGQPNSDGYLLSNLILINLDDNKTTNITSSERVQVIDWSGDRLVYVQIAAGASGNSPKRYRLMSYNYKDDSSKELASSNYFNDVLAAGGAIYYAPSSAFQTGKIGFYKINPDGSNFQTIFDQEVWSIFRTSYDSFALAIQQQWYNYKLGDKNPTKLSNAPSSQNSRVYVDSSDGKHSIWVDNRDGKGVLLDFNKDEQKDATIRSQSGLGYPVRWLNNSSLVYRVVTDQETADYAINIDGGDPVKIKDVTNSGGIDRWYYY